MESLELVVVQLDECKRLVRQGGIGYLRIALILIDNAAEMMLATKISNELAFNSHYKWAADVMAQHPKTKVSGLEEAAAKYVAPKQLQNLERQFDQKIGFLVERGYVTAALGSCLSRLHVYRNEAHHQDKLRLATLEPAVRIYFDIVCGMLAEYYNPPPTYWRIWPAAEFISEHPMLASYVSVVERMNVGALPIEISEQLRADMVLDVASLKGYLVEYLGQRVDEIDSNLSGILDVLLYAEDWNRGDVLRFAQLEENPGHFPPGLEQMRSRNWKYKLSDLERWRKEICLLDGHDDRNDLFAEFARIESDMEPCYDKVYSFFADAEIALQQALDEYRGK